MGKKKRKYSYLNDIKLDENNNYVYQGAMYSCTLDSEERKKLILKMSVLAALMIILTIIAGVMPYEGLMGHAYIVLPYVAQAIFVVLTVSCLYAIYRKEHLREYEYEKSVLRIRPYLTIALISSVLSMINSVVNSVIHGFDPIVITCLYPAFAFAVSLISVYLLRLTKNLVYEQIK